MSAAIRAYLADLGQDGLGDSDADRAQEILLFAINIEHIGDLVANSLLPLAMRWAGRSRAGSEFELGRMLPLQAAIEESLHLAISAFLREDLDAALRLVARKSCCSDWRPMPVASASVACATIAVPGWSPVTCSSAFSATTDASTIMSPPWPIRCSNAAASIRWRSGRTSQGRGGIGMRLLICAGRHFKDAERLRLALDQCHGCNRWRCSATCCMPAAACRTRPSAGAASVARIRAPTIIRSAVAATTPCASMARPSGEAAPDLVLVFPGGRLASELVQVAHAADVPLMLAYRPLSAP